MQFGSWLSHDGLTYYDSIKEAEKKMPPHQSVSNYPPLSARNQNTPLPSVGIATDNARAYPASSSTKHFVPPFPAALQMPVMKAVSSVKDVGEGDRLLRYLKDVLECLQPNSLKGQQYTPFQPNDFSTVSDLLPALGLRLPQLLSNVQKLDNKTEWLRSILRSLITAIECHINLLRKKDAEISELKDRMSRVEERLRQIEGKDADKPVRK